MKDFDLSAFLADLRTLCAIDSGHFNAPGTAAVADFFESRYRALGLKTERRYYDNNDFAPFLTARNSEDEQIDVLFVAHMDTVFPVGTSAQWPLEVDADGLAHGPGCIDCKGGCLSLYYLLRQMLQAGAARPIPARILRRLRRKAATASSLSRGGLTRNLSRSARAAQTTSSNATASPRIPALSRRRARAPFWSCHGG